MSAKLGSRKIECCATYWNPHLDKQEDNDLKQNISEIMGFKEALTDKEKEFICDAFQSSISREGYLDAGALGKPVILKLVDSYRVSLSWSVFDDSSNERAH